MIDEKKILRELQPLIDEVPEEDVRHKLLTGFIEYINRQPITTLAQIRFEMRIAAVLRAAGGDAMKEKTVKQRVNECKKSIVDELAYWKEINENGCNDPFWADGCNMNLTRNHIIWHKHELARICEENGLTLPPEYYLPLPPKVDNQYMANLNQKERIKRLTKMGRRKITTKKKKYDEQQLSLF